MHLSPSISPQLWGHFKYFQSPAGLWRLHLYVWLRRLAWRWLTDGADFAKRALDIVGSAAALIVLSPMLLMVALLVRLDGGPAIFAQTRVGRYGQLFKMYKFRSMRPDAEQRLAELLAAN